MRAVRNFVLGIIVLSTFSFVLPNDEDYKKQVKLKLITHTFENLRSDIQVDVFKNGVLEEDNLTDTKNKFNILLDLNEDYDIHVEQAGCQSKILKIDTSVKGFTKGSLSYVIEVFMKKEIIGSITDDQIRFHLFHGANDKTLLMLADG